MTTDRRFMPGLELSRVFYEEAVAPILAERYPRLTYAAGRLDTGSEVLGFDTPRSMDHWWGPRLTLFLQSEDYSEAFAQEIREVLGNVLPLEIHGFPTHMEEVNRATGTVFLAPATRRPINHMVFVTSVRSFCQSYLGVLPVEGGLSPAEWLVMPEQHLRTIVSGGVWYDGTGELTSLRELVRWYPADVWRYVLAAQWRRIEQEEAFPGRCAEVGDELGSRVVAARLVREVMHLAFLLEQHYMPYSKWLGTAFAQLACAAELAPHLEAALGAGDWPDRERSLCSAYEVGARMQNALHLAELVPDKVSPFYGRPFLVIHGDRFASALERSITDEAVKRLPNHLGNTTQWVDSTDVLAYPSWSARLASLYG